MAREDHYLVVKFKQNLSTEHIFYDVFLTCRSLFIHLTPEARKNICLCAEIGHTPHATGYNNGYRLQPLWVNGPIQYPLETYWEIVKYIDLFATPGLIVGLKLFRSAPLRAFYSL